MKNYEQELKTMRKRIEVVERLIDTCEFRMKDITRVYKQTGKQIPQTRARKGEDGKYIYDSEGCRIYDDVLDDNGNVVMIDEYDYIATDINDESISEEEKIEYKCYEEMIDTLMKLIKK